MKSLKEIKDNIESENKKLAGFIEQITKDLNDSWSQSRVAETPKEKKEKLAVLTSKNVKNKLEKEINFDSFFNVQKSAKALIEYDVTSSKNFDYSDVQEFINLGLNLRNVLFSNEKSLRSDSTINSIKTSILPAVKGKIPHNVEQIKNSLESVINLYKEASELNNSLIKSATEKLQKVLDAANDNNSEEFNFVRVAYEASKEDDIDNVIKNINEQNTKNIAAVKTAVVGIEGLNSAIKTFSEENIKAAKVLSTDSPKELINNLEEALDCIEKLTNNQKIAEQVKYIRDIISSSAPEGAKIGILLEGLKEAGKVAREISDYLPIEAIFSGFSLRADTLIKYAFNPDFDGDNNNNNNNSSFNQCFSSSYDDTQSTEIIGSSSFDNNDCSNC